MSTSILMRSAPCKMTLLSTCTSCTLCFTCTLSFRFISSNLMGCSLYISTGFLFSCTEGVAHFDPEKLTPVWTYGTVFDKLLNERFYCFDLKLFAFDWQSFIITCVLVRTGSVFYWISVASHGSWYTWAYFFVGSTVFCRCLSCMRSSSRSLW